MEDEDDELTAEMFNSQQFKDLLTKEINKGTWDVGLPKCYMDDEGWLVHHWKDGKIDKIKKIK